MTYHDETDPDDIPALSEEDLSLDEGWLEICGTCHGRCNGCVNCWDKGLVPHVHDEETRGLV